MTTAQAIKGNSVFSHEALVAFFDKFGPLTTMWCVLALSIMTVVSSGVSVCS
jgi:hypothetical protein